MCPSFTQTLPPSLTQPHPRSSNFSLQSLFCFPLLFLSVCFSPLRSLSPFLTHTVFLCSLFIYFSLLPPLSHVSPLGHQYSYLNSQTAIETHRIWVSMLCLESIPSTTALHHTLTTVHVTTLHITFSPIDFTLKLAHDSFTQGLILSMILQYAELCAPMWGSGLRHCISVQEVSLQSLVRFCITSGCDWQSHRAAHNMPSIVRVWLG